MTDKEFRVCSFCGNCNSTEQGGDDNLVIIKGKNANICQDCHSLMSDLLSVNQNDENLNTLLNEDNIVFNPKKLVSEISKYVVGQDHAKKTLSVAIYNHYKKVKLNDPDVEKNNVLIIGPSGSGKTLMCSILAKLINVPFYSCDASHFSKTGFKGDDVQSILTSLYIESGNNLDVAQRGIVFIDEVNKIRLSKNSDLDISGKAVQEEFLRMMEGSDFYINTTHNARVEDKIKFNTENVLFIFSGAFEDIYPIVSKRLDLNSSIGFNAVFNNEINTMEYALVSKVIDKDIIEYGFVKEFVSRISYITNVKRLSKENLKDILINSKKSIYLSYKKLFNADNIDFQLTEDAINYIVDKAYDMNGGARSIKSVFSDSLVDLMYDVNDIKEKGFNKIIINKDFFETKNPILENIKKEKVRQNNFEG